MKRFLIVILLLAVSLVGYAQKNMTVKGQIVDSAGEPLIGATVKAAGSTAGTVTDLDGRFSVEVPSKTKAVVVSFVGYKTQTVVVQPGKELKIKMQDDANVLNEVVAIGYGAVKKGDVTASIASVKGEDLEDRPVSNVASALQGELAGVEVRSTTGAPGGEIQITVRGAASINEEMPAYPLYVVDGIPMDDDFDLSLLNMADIQSIDVLKDASSSAIYGSRGANGVVLITSKKAKMNGKTDIRFNASYGLQTPEKRIDNMSPTEWMAWRTKYINSKYVADYGAKGATVDDDFYTRMQYRNFSSTYMADPRWSMPGYGGLALIDWQDEMYGTATFQNYNLSASGGYTRGNYRLSVGYTDHDGMVVNSDFKKLTAQMSGEIKVNDFITAGMRLAPTVSWKNGVAVDGKDAGIATASWRTTPVAEPDAGIYSGAQPYAIYAYGSGVSPYARMERESRLRETLSLQSSAYLNFDITKELQAQLLGSWGYTDNKSRGFTPSTTSSTWASYEVGYQASAAWSGSSAHKLMGQALLTYKKKFGKSHSLNVVAGWSTETTKYGYSYNLGAKQFPNNNIHGFNMTDEVITSATATYNTDVRMMSYFGRVQYNYNDRYLVNASLRTDGNSRFGSNRRWATFPAVSASWRVSNEAFWPKNLPLTDAKVRLSYGQNGSCALPVTAARNLMDGSNYAYGETLYNGFAPAQAESPDLTWQKTHSWNLGFDLGLWRNRVSLAVDIYQKTITDMLFNQSIPSVVGYQKNYTNAGDIRTNGVELELRSNNLTGALKWTTILNMTYMKNEVKSLGDNSTYYTGRGNVQVIEVGHPIGEYYLYDAIGVYMNAEDLANSPHRETSVVGSTKYRDISGPDGVPDGIIDDYDRTHMGSPRPKFMYGLTNKFTWRDFDLSFLITAQTGGKIFCSGGRAYDTAVSASSGYAYNAFSKYQNMWFSEEEPGDGKTPGFVSLADPDASSRFLYSSDFIKLKNITLGYNVPLPQNRYVSKLRVNFSMENLLMWDNYDAGYSPEASNDSHLIGSTDYGSYPLPRTFALGVNVTF